MPHKISVILAALLSASALAQTPELDAAPAPAAEEAQAPAAAVVPFVFGVAPREVVQPAPKASPCSFVGKGLPADLMVIAAGSYAGRKLNFQIDQSGHNATQFDVAVHAERPVALLLAAYEPTVWSVGWTENTRIAAVFVTGYYRQVVAGLPKNVPVITSSFAEKAPCGYHIIDRSLSWVNPKARRIFGVEVTRVYDKAPNGVLDIVESERPKTGYMTSPEVTPESFYDKDAPLAGHAGLAVAVAKDLLRKVTAADIEVVQAHYQARAPRNATGRPDIPPVAGEKPGEAPKVQIPPIRDGYVVLGPFEYPAGLNGGHASAFVVPKGVPRPTGNPGHSTVVDLNSPVLCAGPAC